MCTIWNIYKYKIYYSIQNQFTWFQQLIANPPVKRIDSMIFQISNEVVSMKVSAHLPNSTNKQLCFTNFVIGGLSNLQRLSVRTNPDLLILLTSDTTIQSLSTSTSINKEVIIIPSHGILSIANTIWVYALSFFALCPFPCNPINC